MRARISRFLRSCFARTKPARADRPALRLERLDDRIVPTVTAVGPSSDFQITIDAGEKVEIGRTDNGKLRVTVDGEDLSVQQAASSIKKLTITATGDFANIIDLRGIRPADFVSLTQVTVVSGGGNDTVYGSAFADTIAGGAGNDALYGGGGNDLVAGAAGNDRLYGAAGNDRLIGGAGNDVFYGGPGADILSGGPGTDTFFLDPSDILVSR